MVTVADLRRWAVAAREAAAAADNQEHAAPAGVAWERWQKVHRLAVGLERTLTALATDRATPGR